MGLFDGDFDWSDVGKIGVGLVTGGTGTLIWEGAEAAADANGGKLFSDGKYDAQAAATYGQAGMNVDDYVHAQGELAKWEQQLKEANNPGYARIAQEKIDELRGFLGSADNATREAAYQRYQARDDRALGQAWADKLAGAGNVDQRAFHGNFDAAVANQAGAEQFVANDMLARARGGYDGSAAQAAASAQADEARRALAAAQASRGGAFKASGATMNAMNDAALQANRAGQQNFISEKQAAQNAALLGMQNNAAARTSMASAGGQFQMGVTDRDLQAKAAAANAQMGFRKSAQGSDALGQQPSLAQMEAREAANKRLDAAAQNAANAPSAFEKGVSTLGSLAQTGATIGTLSDARAKHDIKPWGRKSARKSKLDHLMTALKGDL